MNKLNRNQSKGISKIISRDNLENSDYCIKCLQETDISELNLATGVCTSCKCNIKNLTKEQIEKLLELYDV
jgi:hypothetical protein